ncbi:polyphosphate kinase 1 [Coleofasciculus sp. FACHB-64]|uniref:polyphosphate kinase 1 n=1 Tax=Cyanophyceae TaxID=3028117 RepID=UPI00168A21BF|nr:MULTISPECIES: polyphosphate kinase 1 [unclassified Coleofasciculus]MBD1837280.1 polyphosphate kinase 1 [Coleofasciculus sp. FACHB-501]MBD1890224.1 polyphosphate kinase 1 [Coleofasciculus sp. FACHB-SPT9]MBD1898108.1 polyphosphate kinase 1 [Coleofasciculus sp. FACHB-129]MBD2044836.1 polyphosphate kinase 1 [Coleofasciculus sp. FACHB-64]MBD2086043.1 polyphosphate kinase 1 [Coleofasciculus sp. FACHB-542]
MSKAKKTAATHHNIDLNHPQYYFNRELSWLEFNNRVLHEAIDPRTPLLERLKFMGIFSANFDEYFMVRVAALKQQVEAKVSQLTPDGRTPSDQLEEISLAARPLVAQQHQHFEKALRPLMTAQGIHLLDYVDLNQEQRAYLQNYFEEQIFPVLTPLAVDPSHPFPYMSNLSLNLAVVVKDPDTGEELFARVKVPKVLPRFLPLRLESGLGSRSSGLEEERFRNERLIWMGVPLEQVIAHNLESLFPGMNIQEYHPFRITRNADLEVEEDEADDLMLAIEQELRKRRVGGSAVRMEIQASMPESMKGMLMRELGLLERDVYEVDGLLGLADLMYFMQLPLPELKDPVWTPGIPPRLRRLSEGDLDEGEDIFSVIRTADLMVHHPYQSFGGTVQRFITQAAIDPNVLAIKMTLYRTSGDSPILNALITAAEHGKQVAVLVELKARFDEENNINWARKLEQAGVHVVYGLVGLKTHTKVVLVVRREENQIRRYVHIGTGNYNPKTARIYTDVGLLSCREDLGADLTDLFNYLTGYSRQRSYRKLLVSPVNCRDRFLSLIRREIEHCHHGKSGRIVAKMNSLTDPQLIASLYEASIAGVKIDLIIRGICCLRPGVEGVSENIRTISVVGRYLEHSRIFYFQNAGSEEVYIGSADWMRRNLDRRVEAIAPIEDPEISKDLQEILGIMLADNRHAWDLQPDGRYIQRHPGDKEREQSAQKILMEMALQ